MVFWRQLPARALAFLERAPLCEQLLVKRACMCDDRPVSPHLAGACLPHSPPVYPLLGLDLFLVRATPANAFDVLSAGFNKPLLAALTLGLCLVTAVMKSFVTAKRTRARWA